MSITSKEALARLREGNQRYASNVMSVQSIASHMSREDLSNRLPFAVVLGCSDARAPAEILFDQGLGDLFVIRVAGNIVAPSQVGSVEFAAARFGTPLVVVMGHSDCGAIAATLEAIAGGAPASTNVSSIVNRIRPTIEGLVRAGAGKDPKELRREAMRANVRAATNHLRHGSEILESLVMAGKLEVVGAELDLPTGQVCFFDD